MAFLRGRVAWIGLAHRPGTSAALAPLGPPPVVPLFLLPSSVAVGLASAAVTIPVCLDYGGGLSAGDEQVVFEPFRTWAPRRGMGLGLSMGAVMNACRKVCGPTGLLIPARR